jgi:hypothetical protein
LFIIHLNKEDRNRNLDYENFGNKKGEQPEMKQDDEQIKRITYMEKLLNESVAAVEALDNAIEGYKAVQGKIEELKNYYESGLWMEDFDADREGKIPKSLPRGVLTEDAIYDLLTDNMRLKGNLKE